MTTVPFGWPQAVAVATTVTVAEPLLVGSAALVALIV
jgi:hypothetical protein